MEDVLVCDSCHGPFVDADVEATAPGVHTLGTCQPAPVEFISILITGCTYLHFARRGRVDQYKRCGTLFTMLPVTATQLQYNNPSE